KESERITQALEEIEKDIEKGKVDFSQKEDILGVCQILSRHRELERRCRFDKAGMKR
ncbi:unnamed protein product, partial [marine sediment metagenome]